MRLISFKEKGQSPLRSIGASLNRSRIQNERSSTNSPHLLFEEHHDRRKKSLQTRDREEALALLAAKTQSDNQPALNLKMATLYLSASGPKAIKRTWHSLIMLHQSAVTGPSGS